MATKVGIRHRMTGYTIYEAMVCEVVKPLQMRAAVVAAVEAGVSLAGADLSGADLTGAILSGADFTGANIFGADFTDTDVTDCRGILTANEAPPEDADDLPTLIKNAALLIVRTVPREQIPEAAKAIGRCILSTAIARLAAADDPPPTTCDRDNSPPEEGDDANAQLNTLLGERCGYDIAATTITILGLDSAARSNRHNQTDAGLNPSRYRARIKDQQ